MGWDGTYLKYGYTKSDELDEITFRLQPNEILAASKVKNVWYIALKIQKTNEVLCAIILTKRRKNEFICKYLTEHDGAFAYECPNKIMKLLTPLSDPESLAAKWRAKVMARKNAPITLLEADTVVCTPEPVINWGKLTLKHVNGKWWVVKARNSNRGVYMCDDKDIEAEMSKLLENYNGKMTLYKDYLEKTITYRS